MVRIVAAMKIYNEIWHIKKTMQDIIELVDHIVIIDGAWQHFPGGTPRSTDGTREFFKELVDSGISIDIYDNGDSLWDNQPVARNQYFKYGRPGDWLFQVDGDYEIDCSSNLKSWIEGNVNENINTIMVPFINDFDYSLCHFPLIMKWETGLNYQGNHYRLFINSTRRAIMSKRIPTLTIHHVHKGKPEERIESMKEYSIWRRDRNWKED